MSSTFRLSNWVSSLECHTQSFLTEGSSGLWMCVCVELLPKFCLQISFKLLDKILNLDLMFTA